MNSKLVKKLFIILLIVFITPYFIYAISMHREKNKMEKYISDKYPHLRYVCNEVLFDFFGHLEGYDDGFFIGKFTTISSEPIKFVVYYDNSSMKETYSTNKIVKEAEKMVLPYVCKEIPKDSINYFMINLAEENNEQTEYSKNIGIFLYISWSGDEITKDIFINKTLSLLQTLKDNSFNVKFITADYEWVNQNNQKENYHLITQ